MVEKKKRDTFHIILFINFLSSTQSGPKDMEGAIGKLRQEIEEFLDQLQTKRKQFKESIQRDDVLADLKKILSEIRQLEAKILELVEDYFRPDAQGKEEAGV